MSTSKDFTRRGTLAMGLGAASLAAGCAAPISQGYAGPKVTHIQVQKDRRVMYLLSDRDVLKSYKVQLGFTARGPKRHRGDGRTPEGRYFINRRNPNSDFYLSIGISYPNSRDVAWAAERGLDPGGDIFIHGWGDTPKAAHREDWTAGCIAVTDREMYEIYLMVQNGTIVDILP
jgi:murein L,D-transpeptidase YafK